MVANSTRSGESPVDFPALRATSLTLGITRLKNAAANLQQSLPEMKRSGEQVLNAIALEQLYDETSTARAGTVLEQAEFIPGLIQQLQDEPKKVIEEFELIRQTRELGCTIAKAPINKPTLCSVTRPERIRFSVTGNILDIKNPKKPWREHFGNLASTQGHFRSSRVQRRPHHPQSQTTLQPVPFSNQTLSAIGRKPSNRVQRTPDG